MMTFFRPRVHLTVFMGGAHAAYAARRFLYVLSKTTRLPIFVLTDPNPGGINICWRVYPGKPWVGAPQLQRLLDTEMGLLHLPSETSPFYYYLGLFINKIFFY